MSKIWAYSHVQNVAEFASSIAVAVAAAAAGLLGVSSSGRAMNNTPQSGTSTLQSGSSPSAPINLAEPRPRRTQVLLPNESETQVRHAVVRLAQLCS